MRCGACGSRNIEYDEDLDFHCVMCGRFKANPRKPNRDLLPKEILKIIESRVGKRKGWL
jgi:hypothetical protein